MRLASLVGLAAMCAALADSGVVGAQLRAHPTVTPVAPATATPRPLHPRLRTVSVRTSPTLPAAVAAQTLSRLGSGVGTAVNLQAQRAYVDGDGMTHTRVQHVVGGVPVLGSMAVVHTRTNGSLADVTDRVHRNITVATTPSVPANVAIGLARQRSGLTGVSQTSSLVILPEGQGRLVHKVELERLTGPTPVRQVVYVDARTGATVRAYDALQTGRGRGLFTNGEVTFETSKNGAYGPHVLESRTKKHATYTKQRTDNATGPVASQNDRFDTAEAAPAVDVHFATERFFDWLSSRFGRVGLDGQEGPAWQPAMTTPNLSVLPSYVQRGPVYNNAFWNGRSATYGAGDGATYNPMVSPDIVAHELTHGLIDFTAGLVYEGESGALNEAYADVLGVMFKRHLRGENVRTWLVGDEVTKNGRGIRSVKNPEAFGDPIRMAQFVATSDVHVGSGIGRKAFALLALGGTHDSINVPAIGVEDALSIWYRALTTYLTPLSNHMAARKGMVRAAVDLFGIDSPQVASTHLSWVAVGVRTPLEALVDMYATVNPTLSPALVARINPFLRRELFNYLQNGSFDDGATGWLLDNATLKSSPTCVTLAQTAAGSTPRLRNMFTVPSLADPLLTFRVVRRLAGAATSAGGLKVIIRSGEEPETVLASVPPGNGPWAPPTPISLQAYRGKPSVLRFVQEAVPADRLGQIEFDVDDVQVY